MTARDTRTARRLRGLGLSPEAARHAAQREAAARRAAQREADARIRADRKAA